MKAAFLFAHWLDFGEQWNSPISWVKEFESRDYQIDIFNLYHANGLLHPKRKIRHYSDEGLNTLYAAIRNGYRPDFILLFDYGVYDSHILGKKLIQNIPWVLELGDLPQSARMHEQKINKFDASFGPDHLSVDLFNKAGFNCHWLTHFADERIFYPRNIEPIYDVVTTCGGRVLYKDKSPLTQILASELGTRFNNERYFFGEEHVKRLHMGKIVFQASQFGEVTRRIFEGMACGRMVLTDRLPEHTKLHELFINGKDIVFYDNAKDAIEKINYYVEHEEEREKIAQSGYQKVMKNHTVKSRVDALLKIINNLKK